ncbi:N-acetyltransferase family protein [Runella sp.]|uniref:GNAT family N-acetyltransferase n=1 Tax=Runella sp. TaxID=1960881 RepID=UPI003D0E0E93
MFIQIRKAQAIDFPELAAVFLEVRRQVFTWKDINSFREEDFYEQTSGELILLAEDDEQKIVGFISVWEPDRFIHHLYIKSGYQGRRIGKRLIDSLSVYISFPYQLKCESKNDRALHFYAKNGWQEIGRGINEGEEYVLLQLKTGK